MAIAEAAHRPHIQAVPIKTVEQQDIQSLHRIRERYVAKRTGVMNHTRGLLSEYGIISPQEYAAFCKLLRELFDPKCRRVSPILKVQLGELSDEYYLPCDRVQSLNNELKRIADNNPWCQILLSIPGDGPINATAIYSSIGRGQQFKSAREFAVWLGLTPRQSSSGESFKSLGITKRGNRYLRKQLVHGARAVISRCRKKEDSLSNWANQLVARRGMPKAMVAMAARMARIAWVLLNREEYYKVM